jgi:solute carrier family 13 (sodium-dependent dicarboxylate transporter), member 2/3/5
LPLGLPYSQQTLAAVLAFVVVYWVTEAIPIPVTAVIGLALAVSIVLITLGITVMARLVGLA